MRRFCSFFLALALAPALPSLAFAVEPAAAAAPAAPAAPAMDMSKMGPWARKPTNPAKTKKEIAAFFKAEAESAKKGDLEGCLSRVDFPVYMVTDDATGKTESKLFDRDQYAAMMKPFYDNTPKDVQTSHKPTITVLSDSLAAVSDSFVMKMGKQKLTGDNGGLLIKVGNDWKWKMMVEAGWGGMHAPEAGK
jgi:hypothetical protein